MAAFASDGLGSGRSHDTAAERKIALSTGSTSNIGRAAAVAFRAEGARVVVTDRDSARGAAVLPVIRAAGGRADYVHADLDGTAAASRGLADAETEVLG